MKKIIASSVGLVLLAGVLVIGSAADLWRSSGAALQDQNKNQNRNSNTNSNRNSNGNRNSNSDDDDSNSNANSNGNRDHQRHGGKHRGRSRHSDDD